MLYKHDCEDCKSLGEFNNTDLYYCEGGIGTTVISRFGDNGPDYSSGMIFATEDGDPNLFEAKKRAIEKGYII
tara:strand:- start:68765 stop:68983 length:219 start_codon:yes stop_codon:yes gene_type:complete